MDYHAAAPETETVGKPLIIVGDEETEKIPRLYSTIKAAAITIRTQPQLIR